MEPATGSTVTIERVPASQILEDAKTFYKHCKKIGRHATYHDYERFKHELHDNGWFGDEYNLARILHL